jgi:hypothetical protein
MTKVIVNSGACGFTVTIRTEKAEGGKITVSLETDCEMVKMMVEDIAVLDQFAPLSGSPSNPVHRSAAKHLRHAACIVPSGILKAIEVEAGLNVTKDATIIFVTDK